MTHTLMFSLRTFFDESWKEVENGGLFEFNAIYDVVVIPNRVTIFHRLGVTDHL